MTDWSAIARKTIAQVHCTLPPYKTFKERLAAIDAAYPFGERSMWPYKAWLKARREYRNRYDPALPPPPPLFADLPRDPVTGRPLII